MSLSEVSRKLDAKEYGSPKDFTDDLVLIVKNSEVYNTDIRSLVSYCGTHRHYNVCYFTMGQSAGCSLWLSLKNFLVLTGTHVRTYIQLLGHSTVQI